MKFLLIILVKNDPSAAELHLGYAI